MNYILFDNNRLDLLPFTHTRAVADIRCGILTMRERWEKHLGETTATLTQDYLSPLYPAPNTNGDLYVNGGVAASADLVKEIRALSAGEKLVKDDLVIAARVQNSINTLADLHKTIATLSPRQANTAMWSLQHIWDIFSLNEKAIREDFTLLTTGRKSHPLPANITVTGAENIFIEEGAVINAGVIINATTGPVYIGKDAEIMEGCIIRGSLAICEHAVLKMGAKVYTGTTLGPGCKAGGEISNVVFFANSNKGHDGFLGNAVVGEWCNLGADTNCSNLKNNYDEVKIWSEQSNKLVRTGLTFCGLLMGDHSKCGINTMFNTGTVVGVSANIYGGSFPDKFIPSFSWGGSEGMVTYQFDKAMETANRMMARRDKSLSDAELKVYRHIFDAATATRP